MKLNLSVLIDELSAFIEWADVRDPSMLYEQFSFIDQKGDYNVDHIYIWDFDQRIALPHILPSTCIFLYCDDSDSFPTLLNRIMVKKGITANHLVEILNGIFFKYSTWSDQLKGSLLKQEGIKRLFELSMPLFNNSICYISNAYRVMFLTEPETGIHLAEVYGEEMKEDQIIGQEMMHTIQTSTTYESTMKPGANIWEEERWNGKFMSVNYYEETQIMGCVLLSDCNQAFRPGDKYLLEYLTELVIYSIKHGNWYHAGNLSSIRQILNSMINQNLLPSDSDLMNFAITCEWNISDSFLFLHMYPGERELKRKMLFYHCTNLEKMVSNSRAYEYNSRIVYIINLSKTQYSFSEINRLLNDYCSRNKIHTGVSRRFQSLKKMLEGCQQALIAYQFGFSEHPEKYVYRFEDYALYYMLNNICGKLTCWQLFPDGLLALHEHDGKTGKNYCQILKVYLENNCNITKCVNALFMHRNTFLYQLDQIKDMLDMDLKDPDTRLYLQLCIKISGLASDPKPGNKF